MAYTSIKPVKRAKKIFKFRVVNKHIVESDGCVGQTWPGVKPRVIEIDPRQGHKDYMDTLIHEALHHLFPKARERKILKSGTTIAHLLWRLGYRRVKARRKVVPQEGIEPPRLSA